MILLTFLNVVVVETGLGYFQVDLSVASLKKNTSINPGLCYE